jgi:hypothetical protein
MRGSSVLTGPLAGVQLCPQPPLLGSVMANSALGAPDLIGGALRLRPCG